MTPVMVDSEPDTWNMDPELLETAIRDRIGKTGKKPKAIVPVALYGMPYKADRIMKIAKEHNLRVIEDCAQACGATYHGQFVGTFGDCGCFSFQYHKTITAGEGHFSGIDLGIGKYHFEVGAGKENFDWQ